MAAARALMSMLVIDLDSASGRTKESAVKKHEESNLVEYKQSQRRRNEFVIRPCEQFQRRIIGFVVMLSKNHLRGLLAWYEPCSRCRIFQWMARGFQAK
jgi:hypothetical protein